MPQRAACLASCYTVTLLRGSGSSSPGCPGRHLFQRLPNTLKPSASPMPEHQLSVAGHGVEGAVPIAPVLRVRYPTMLECPLARGADDFAGTDQLDD